MMYFVKCKEVTVKESIPIAIAKGYRAHSQEV